MNKKVFVSMLVLTIVFLVSLYIAKIFFPAQFVLAIENETLISIGTFVDTHKWCYYLVASITAFITYWLYLCACCGKKYLNLWQSLIVVLVIGISFILNEYSPNIAMYYGLCIMIILPAILKGKLLNVAIVYSTHIFAQYLSMNIRSLPLLFSTFNSLIGLVMTLECYLWLLLFYIIFNYKKKES